MITYKYIARLFLISISIITSQQTKSLDERQWMKLENFYKNKTVLITGGCGFIGSHLAAKLVNLGAQVTIMDNLSTGFMENISAIKNMVSFLPLDITNLKSCIQATTSKDIIFHLAAFISVPESINNPTACFNTNVAGTFNLLEAARLNGVKRFILSSSAAVYGPHEGICKESTPCNPTSPYGFSKLINEQLCTQYRTNFNLETAALRYFNVWGPRQNPNGAYAAVVAKFSDQIAHNTPITIFGDGSQTRDFIHVSQVVEANLTIGMLASELDKYHIFNIATGNSITLLELIDQLKQQSPHYKQEIQFMSSRPGDVQHSVADCNRYQTLINQQ